MVVNTLYLNNQIVDISLDKYHEDLKAFQFFGNLEHLQNNKQMYYIAGDEIKLDPNYESKMQDAKTLMNLNNIREIRKPLLQAFDTLEFKRKFILDGFIAVGEFPFIDSMSEERWIEIKIWRDMLKDLTEGDLLNYQFPNTPLEVKQFL